MSETTPGETPVERRLRGMCEDGPGYGVDIDAIDAGREALALLRQVCIDLDRHDGMGKITRAEIDALLARCEGDR